MATSPALTSGRVFLGDEHNPPVRAEFFASAPLGQAFLFVQASDGSGDGTDDAIGLTRSQASALAEWILRRLASEKPSSGAKS